MAPRAERGRRRPCSLSTATEAARAHCRAATSPREELVRRLPGAHRRARAADRRLDLPRPRARAGAGQGRRRSAPGRQGRRPAARRSRRHQGHHRHRRHADRERLRRLQGPPALERCGLRHGAAPRRRRHPRQDRDDGACSLTIPSRTRNPRNLEHTPGGSSSGSAAAVAAGMVPARARHADRRLRHPPGRLLRRLRLQADVRRSSRAPAC